MDDEHTAKAQLKLKGQKEKAGAHPSFAANSCDCIERDLPTLRAATTLAGEQESSGGMRGGETGRQEESET